MTDQPMLTYSEVWPLGADEVGIWLLSGEVGPWPSEYVSRYSDPNTMAEIELIQHGVTLGDRLVLHSTSWRIDYSPETGRNFQVDTFMAAIPIDGLVLDRWPSAKPITPEVFELLGPAPTHGPAELPEVPFWAVLEHGLGHLAYLLVHDATIAAALDGNWGEHLAAFAPVIARMYSRVHESA